MFLIFGLLFFLLRGEKHIKKLDNVDSGGKKWVQVTDYLMKSRGGEV